MLLIVCEAEAKTNALYLKIKPKNDQCIKACSCLIIRRTDASVVMLNKTRFVSKCINKSHDCNL